MDLRRRGYGYENKLDEASGKFKKGKFEIAVVGGQKKEVDGYSYGVWGVNKHGGKWAITHIPSGLVAIPVPSLAVGKAAAEKMISDIPELENARSTDDIIRHKDYFIGLRKEAMFSPQGLVPSSKAKPIRKSIDYASDLEAVLRDGGLQNLGRRYGKAGTMWGIKGLARQISVGRRDVMRNYFYVLFSHDDRRPDTRWNNKDAEYLSKMTPERLREWIAWVKAAKTTKDVIADARRKYWDAEEKGEDRYPVGSSANV